MARLSLSIPDELQARLQKYIIEKKGSLRAQSEAIKEFVEAGLKEAGY